MTTAQGNPAISAARPANDHLAVALWIQSIAGSTWEVELLEIRDRHQRYGLHPAGTSTTADIRYTEPLVYVDVEHRLNPLDPSTRAWQITAHRRETGPGARTSSLIHLGAPSSQVGELLKRAAPLLKEAVAANRV